MRCTQEAARLALHGDGEDEERVYDSESEGDHQRQRDEHNSYERDDGAWSATNSAGSEFLDSDASYSYSDGEQEGGPLSADDFGFQRNRGGYGYEGYDDLEDESDGAAADMRPLGAVGPAERCTVQQQRRQQSRFARRRAEGAARRAGGQQRAEKSSADRGRCVALRCDAMRRPPLLPQRSFESL